MSNIVLPYYNNQFIKNYSIMTEYYNTQTATQPIV